MVRIPKKLRMQGISFRKRKPAAEKTGPKQDNLPSGFKQHQNSLAGEVSAQAYIAKIK